MKRIRVLIVLLLSVSSTILPADNDLQIFLGRTGYPYFDSSGYARILYQNLRCEWRKGEPGRNPDRSRPLNFLNPEGGVQALLIKKDGADRLWMVLQTEQSQRSDIYLGRMTRRGPESLDRISGFSYQHNIREDVLVL